MGGQEDLEIDTGTTPRYSLTRSHDLRTVPGGHEVHYMVYTLRSADGSLEHYLEVPCRAKLHHALTGLFYAWEWKDEEDKAITFDEAMMLKHVFTSQTEYKLWKRTLEQINKLGVDKAKEWLIDQVKVLALRKVIRGE